jgi:uncharacterized membrane protein
MWHKQIFLISASMYVVVFSALAVARYFSFRTGYLGVETSWDLGQYAQLIWNSLNGRLLEGSFVQDTATFLGKSFTPILLAFVPLYAVWQSPIVLLIVQVAGLGLAGLPIYWFARQRLGGAFAIVVALAFYLHPGLDHIGLTEFHEIALAVPLLAFATFFLLREHYAGFFVCLALALLVKEEIGLIAMMFGVYIMLFQRKHWRVGVGVALFGAVWVIVLLQYAIPFFRGAQYGQTFYYFGEGKIGGGGTRYSYLGRSIPEVLTTILIKPGYVLSYVLIPEKIAYVLHLLVPLAFLPIIGWDVFLLTLPTFGYSLLSTYGLQYEIRSYYFAPLLPFLYFALIVGIQRVLEHTPRLNLSAWRNALMAALLVASVASYFLQSAGPFARYFQAFRYDINAHTRLGDELAASIPHDAVVIAQNEYLARLANRQFIYEIPVIPDYRQADYLFADQTMNWYNVHLNTWQEARQNDYYETVIDRDGYWLAKRRTPAHPLQIRFGDAMTLTGYSIVLTDTLRGGMTVRPSVEWRARRLLSEHYFMTVTIVDAQGHLWVRHDAEPQDGATPTTRWQTTKPVGDQYALALPPTMPAGDYDITLSVHISNTLAALPAFDANDNALGDEIKLAQVHVEKNKSSFTASELWWIEERLYVDMGDLRLLGFVPPRQTISPGEMLPIGVYWRARAQPHTDYVVAVQFRDANDRVAFEQAAQPANNTYPTTQWNAGEVLLDWHDVQIPSQIAAGTYQIVVVLQDTQTRRAVGETPIAKIQVVR